MPGRHPGLRALGRRRRANIARLRRGKKPIVGGKKIARSTFIRKFGTPAALRKRKK